MNAVSSQVEGGCWDDGADYGIFFYYFFSLNEMHPMLINHTAYVKFSTRVNSLTVLISAWFIPLEFLFRGIFVDMLNFLRCTCYQCLLHIDT